MKRTTTKMILANDRQLSEPWTPAREAKRNKVDALISKKLRDYLEVGDALSVVQVERLWERDCDSFQDYCVKIHSINANYARKLIQSAAVVDVIMESGTAVPLSSQGIPIVPLTERSSRPLTKLDTPAQQTKAWTAAVKEAGGEQPTSDQVEAAAEKVKAEAEKAAARDAKRNALTTPAEKSPEVKSALVRIGKVCGKPARDAYENGIVTLSDKDLVTMANLDDDKMKEVDRLVSVKRWSVAQCLSFLSDFPVATWKIERLHWLALANGGGVCCTIDGFDHIITHRKKR